MTDHDYDCDRGCPEADSALEWIFIVAFVVIVAAFIAPLLDRWL